MKKIGLFFAMLVLVVGILAGCGTTNNNNAANNQNNNNQHTTENTTQADFPVTVTDGNGDELTLDKKPERIVSILPSDTETAFALGLGNEIVGVSDNDTYPEEVKDKERVGGMELNVEKILSLDPQLVLAGQMSDQDAVKQMREADIPVLVVKDATNFADTYKAIKLIGETTGTLDKADDIVKGMKDKLAKLKDTASKIANSDQKKVYVEISPSPDIYTVGQNTFIDQMLTMIHADNVFESQDGYPKINEEAVVKENPDVIITTYGKRMGVDPLKEMDKRDGWSDITAVKDKQVIDVNDDLTNRPGPRLVDGVEALGKAIYPDVFGE